MEELIRALHTLYKEERLFVLSENENKLLLQEKEHFLSKETRYEYAYDITDLTTFSSKESLANMLKVTLDVFYKSNFWITHSNPGNVLYHYHDFHFVLEYYWCYLLNVKEEGRDINTKWEYPKNSRAAIYKILGNRMNKPWKYLNRQFEKRSLEQWRLMLERCMIDVLSNQKIDDDNSKEYTELLNFLTVLLEFNDILQYEPKSPAHQFGKNTSFSCF